MKIKRQNTKILARLNHRAQQKERGKNVTKLRVEPVFIGGLNVRQWLAFEVGSEDFLPILFLSDLQIKYYIKKKG